MPPPKNKTDPKPGTQKVIPEPLLLLYATLAKDNKKQTLKDPTKGLNELAAICHTQ